MTSPTTPHAKLRQVVESLVPQRPALATMLFEKHRASRPSADIERLSAWEYSYVFEQDFEEGLFFVPRALEEVESLLPDYGEICNHLTLYLWVWKDRLIAENAFDPIMERMFGVFDHWNRHFTPHTRVDRTMDGSLTCRCDLLHPIPFDVLLEALSVTTLHWRDANARDTLFENWSQDTSSSESSACFLDFALRAKCCPTVVKLLQEPLVLNALFDCRLMEKHWECCQSIVQTRCDEEYVDMLEEQLIYA